MNLPSYRALISTLSLASIILVSGISSASTNKIYHLKGDRVSGSNIRTIDASSSIPFNKRYMNLSVDEKKLFNDKFENLSALDTPPFPRLGLRTIYRPIVKANREIAASGSLHLSATVNANGFVESVEVLKSPNVELTEVAKQTLLKTRFDPASCNGLACKMAFPLAMTFK